MAAKVLPSRRLTARGMAKRTEAAAAASPAPRKVHAKLLTTPGAQAREPPPLARPVASALTAPRTGPTPAQKAIGAGSSGRSGVAAAGVASVPAEAPS